jgi:hypothetical protein
VPAPGDTFIFKGGVTWPVTSCWTIPTAGTSAKPITYGVDQTWYDGAAWTRPKFDAGGVELRDGYDVMVQAFKDYVVFDNLELTGLYWSGNKNYGWVSFITLGTAHDVTIKNCYIHKWTHAPMPTTDQLKVILGSNSSPFNPGCVITNCLIDGDTPANSSQGQSSGEATYAFSGNVFDTTVRNTISGPIVTGDPKSTVPQIVAGCNIGPCFMGYDPGDHPDGLFMNGGRIFYWYSNRIHDCRVEAMYVGEGAGAEQVYAFNNLFYGNHVEPIVSSQKYSGNQLYVWNNTFVTDRHAIRIAYRPEGPRVGTLDMRNNLIIGSGSLHLIERGTSVTTLVDQNNAKITAFQASAHGFKAANNWTPASAKAPTVGAGQDMSSLLGGLLCKDIVGVARQPGQSWDIGAFQYTGTVQPPSAGQSEPGGSPRRN